MFRFLQKARDRKERAIEENITEMNAPLEDRKIQPSLQDNITLSKQIFTDMDIIRYRAITHNNGKTERYYLIYCDGMINNDVINNNIIRPLTLYTLEEHQRIDSALLAEVVQVGEIETAESFRRVVEYVTSGNVALFAEGCPEALLLNAKKWALRSIQEPDSEKTLVGPREGFTESLLQNLSQVVRRARTNELKTKFFNLGRRTKTPVCVCYLDGLVNKSMLEDLTQRLKSIDIDGILDVNYINELIRDRPASPFRTTGYTERPDTIVGKLLEGRMAIFVEGSPMVLTVPYLFIENFQSSEDYYLSSYYTSFARFIRICAFILTVTIPGLYIAVVAFHQEMLPLQLLIQIALERKSVPLPAALEAVVMLLVFDILRETGIRMPSNIGQALSIVGALVIGQAAVAASLVAAPMIIVVASTGITSLLVPRLNAPVISWRFLLLFLSTAMGFYGFTIGLSLLLIHIINLTSLGLEQTTLRGAFRFQDVKDIAFRVPWPLMKERQPSAVAQNTTRLSEDDDHA